MAVVVLIGRLMHRGVLALIIAAVLALGGWPAVGANGGLMDQFERSVGAGAVPELLKAYGGEYDLPVWERQWVDAVFQRLVGATSRGDAIPYSLTVLNSPEINAFALPGGFLFITRGMLRDLQGDPHRLAAVLGHELAHVELKHGINSVLRQLGMTVLVEVGMFWLDVATPELVRAASAALLQLLRLGWGREAEFEADLLGQELAAAAGFDPVGAVMLMDYLLSIESEERSAGLFSTHPDSAARRARAARRLVNFWSDPVRLDESAQLKVLRDGRNSPSVARMDLKGRFTVDLRPGAKGTPTLVVYDAQLQEERKWLGDQHVTDAAWSPSGSFLAVIVVDDAHNYGIQILDRLGRVVQEWWQPLGSEVFCLRWDPAGQRLAYLVDDGEHIKLVVGYVPGKADLVVYSGEGIADMYWWEDASGVVFNDGSHWYLVRGPRLEPVIVVNPIPRVLERKSFFSPTIEWDGDTIRLTRPQLSIP